MTAKRQHEVPAGSTTGINHFATFVFPVPQTPDKGRPPKKQLTTPNRENLYKIEEQWVFMGPAP